MGAAEMEIVADLMAAVLIDGRDPAEIKRKVITDAGRAALAEWLASPSARQRLGSKERARGAE
jgi:hypothetical protein